MCKPNSTRNSYFEIKCVIVIPKENILRIRSISNLCEIFGYDRPTHPLISVVPLANPHTMNENYIGQKIVTELYTIALKDKSCGVTYGRHNYDFDEGVLLFTAPNQSAVVTKMPDNNADGWLLFFHPDLIRNTHLEKIIEKYHYFSYDVHEALHLSSLEEDIITDCIRKIKHEIEGRIDNHSQAVIISSLELLLNYCQRYYERQFNTRTSQNKELVTTVDNLLKQYFEQGNFASLGIPSIHFLAEKVFLSSHYFSDLLKKETGISAKEYINTFIVDKAKTMLLGTSNSVSEIAFSLGFSYPHYFSRLFKSKMGMSPNEYRQAS